MDWLEIKEFFKDTAKIVVTIAIVLVVIVYVVSITQVVGNSMHPTLKDGEILILNKLKYKITEVKRGDIISLKYADTYISTNLKYDDFDLKTLGYEKIPDGYYFVLGDNRENSMDSREIGLIPKKDIIGKVSIRFWPFNKFKFL